MKIAKNYDVSRKEVFSVITELDRKKDKLNGIYELVAISPILLLAISWLFYLIFTFFNKQYQNFYQTKSFITVTDLSSKEYRYFLDSKNKAVLYGVGAMMFAVTSGLVTTAIWWLVSRFT